MRDFDVSKLLESDYGEFSNQIIWRELLIPDIFGAESDAIIYFYGKQLIDKLAISDFEQLQAFFEKAQLGTLTQTKQKKNQVFLTLTGNGIQKRLTLSPNASFNLEAGLLARFFERQQNALAETTHTVEKNRVNFTVQSDFSELPTAD